MTTVDMRAMLLSCLDSVLTPYGEAVERITDETDLRAEGLIDSLGFLRLLTELERRLGASVDLSDADPARLTHVGTIVGLLTTTLQRPDRGSV